MPARAVHGKTWSPTEALASLGDSVLDSLADRIAVLDATGTIIAVNGAWRAFATACRADPAATCEGANYIAICDRAAGEDAAGAHRVSALLRELCSGARAAFSAEYPCHGPEPGQRAWFELRATAFLRNGSRFITVLHSDRTRRIVAERERERARAIIARLRRLTHDLHQARSRLRRAQQAAGIVAFEMPLQGAAPAMPDALRELLDPGPHADAPPPPLMALVHPSDRPALAAALSALSERGGPLAEEFRLARADGEERWIQLLGAGDPKAGPPFPYVGVALDVTERRRGEAQRDLLVREIDHRAKNVLAVVQAVLRLSRPGGPAAYVEALEGRIAAIARAHILISQGSRTGASLRGIVEGELAAYHGAGDPAAIAITGPELALAPGAAQAFSLVLHELATNSAKYGALSCSTGRLTVGWRIDEAARQLTLAWHERGGPPIAGPPNRPGFGTRVITSTVRYQLGGRLVQDWGEAGLHAEIIVPLARVLCAGE